MLHIGVVTVTQGAMFPISDLKSCKVACRPYSSKESSRCSSAAGLQAQRAFGSLLQVG